MKMVPLKLYSALVLIWGGSKQRAPCRRTTGQGIGREKMPSKTTGEDGPHCSQGCLCPSVQFSSVAQSCPTLCNPMNHSTPGLPVHHHLPEFTQTHLHRVQMPSNHLILCRPLLLLPPVPPSIRVFSNESTLRMRWPKYWSFSFSIIPSKEHPRLISFIIIFSFTLFYNTVLVLPYINMNPPRVYMSSQS